MRERNLLGECKMPDADSMLPPTLDIVVTRRDVLDEASFRGTGVLALFETLFPPNERDDPDDIVRWVMADDVGERRGYTLNGKEIDYRLDSRCFILRVAERAIGLGLFTYDYASRLIYCNYVGVQTAWRGGGMARAFYREMCGMLDDLFPHNMGVVLEVEPFDQDRLEAIISDLERTGARQLDENDRAEIRKFLRVSWYHKLNYTFFIDSSIWRPIACRSPCIDPSLPRLGWADEEADYWLMWHARAGESSATPDAAGLWRRAVDAIYLEILAKSLVAADPAGRRDYWDYATALVAQTLKRTTMVDVGLASYLGSDDSPLLARWRHLKIDLPI